MKEGQTGLGTLAAHLDGNPVIFAVVGIRRLVADDVLIMNLAGHGGGRVGDAAPVVDGEGAAAGEFGDFAEQCGAVGFAGPHLAREIVFESQGGSVDLRVSFAREPSNFGKAGGGGG